ncbi:MAG: BREX system P-loop protein BrxC [Erysipelotrichaceae bacterium]|nr:BREX system P-loop protein BrxC [Erysipelotrichaceae bacterium]
MIIKELFKRDIERNINGVIKIGNDDDSKQQELEEYVVTRELRKHFSQFFDQYTSTINSSTKNIGVWISGFYGSGKSHFMKILSYILENKECDGKSPVDYFIDGEKIDDDIVIANMRTAASMPSDIMLFNIESLSNDDHDSKEAILSVFLRAFNRQLGYDDRNPMLADFERHLDDEDKYDLFKDRYLEVVGKDWVSDRKNIKFRRKKFVQVVTELDIMDEADANQLCKDIHDNVRMSVEDFAKMIAEYCNKKGPNHRVVFLVDEIGQYIADDSKLLLNLQTISEDFSTYCKGQAWIIVTSQQNIDEVTKVRGEDFSKIQARFNMRLSLSSSDVAEVIQKRILDKTDVARDTLTAYYDGKESIIKNLIDFSNNTQFKRKYSSAEDFANIYPFIPYQFDLLSNVLNEIRNNSSSGKHLSEGERSMLALIQESAIAIKDNEIGTLVSFNKFYDCLEKWIDHQYRNVIDNAIRNEELEPFDVEVLKVLFMIKYVKEIKADITNITTLMIDHVDQDRVDLTKHVEEALKRLIRQTYVQKDGDYYSFLTNAEQDLNRAIKNEFIEHSEIMNELRTIIFGELYREHKFRYNSRYSFPFNEAIDDPQFTTNYPISLLIITPYNDYNYTDDELRPLSMQKNCVIFKLPDNTEYQEEIKNYLQISKYLRKNSSNKESVFLMLKSAKQEELNKSKERIRISIEQGLKDADVFVHGNNIQIASKNVTDRINDALGRLVDNTYNKLTYMETAPTQSDFMRIFTQSKDIHFEGMENNDNQLALDEVYRFVEGRNARAENVNYKTILDYFTKNPYGYVYDDIHWLTLKLFKDKKIDLKIDGELIQESYMKPNNIISTVTTTRRADKLIVSIKKQISTRYIKNVNDLCKDLDSSYRGIEDSDALMDRCKEIINTKINELKELQRKYDIESRLPGKQYTDDLVDILSKVRNKKEPMDFYEYINDNYDDILDALDDFDPVNNFFKGNQSKIFYNALACMDLASSSETYLDDQIALDNLKQIKTVIENKNPYDKIPTLPTLIDNFNSRFRLLVDKEKKSVLNQLDEIEQDVKDELGDNAQLRQIFISRISTTFTGFRNTILQSKTLADPHYALTEANFMKNKLSQQITDKKKELATTNDNEDHHEDNPTETSKKVIKPITTINVNELFNNADKLIENEDDIDRNLQAIKRKLLKEVNSGKQVIIKIK